MKKMILNKEQELQLSLKHQMSSLGCGNNWNPVECAATNRHQNGLPVTTKVKFHNFSFVSHHIRIQGNIFV
jgi:hypothetical protein